MERPSLVVGPSREREASSFQLLEEVAHGSPCEAHTTRALRAACVVCNAKLSIAASIFRKYSAYFLCFVVNARSRAVELPAHIAYPTSTGMIASPPCSVLLVSIPQWVIGTLQGQT
jgi:hypothetical protein